MISPVVVQDLSSEHDAPGRPAVSIGLPVFNGGSYLEQAISSILGQTFTDFELVISDNGSTDNTESICRTYAAADARIHYYRHQQTRGVTWNFRQVAQLAKGTYFMWLATDDILSPTYIERCLQALQQDSEIVLCYSQAEIRDGNGTFLRYEEQKLTCDSPRPDERFRELIRMDHNCGAMFGLMRTDVLKKTPIHADFPDSDRCLLAELALYGKFRQVPESLFCHREHAQRVTRRFPSRQERMWNLFPGRPPRLVFPHFRQLREYIFCVGRAPLSFTERLRCARHLLGWVKENSGRLWRDLECSIHFVLRAGWRTTTLRH